MEEIYDSFQCLGADCPDTCCVGWRVTIDRVTYDKYRDSQDVELAPRFRQLVTINAEPTTHDYASIQTLDSACPFLSRKLCSIQTRLGEDYLSRTCATFPRVKNVVGDVTEKSLDLSCPEAARLLLTRAHPISLHPGPGADDELMLRERILSLLQDTKYSLAERLSSVGIICDAPSSMPIVQSEDASLQLKIVLELIVERVRLDYTPQRYLNLYQDFAHGLQIDKSATWAAMGARYSAAERDDFEPFMRNQPDLLGRYLACYAYKTMLPVGSPIIRNLLKLDDKAKQFQVMIAHYAVIRAVLIGLAVHHKSAFTLQLALETIQACSKTLEHCMPYPQAILRILQSKGSL